MNTSCTPDTPTVHLSKRAESLACVACGVAIGSAYYVQPLLIHIAHAFSLPIASVGFVPMASQIGIWFGVLLLLPLGDRLDGRKLIVVLLLVNAVGLVTITMARTSTALLVTNFFVGFTTVTPYLLPPLVSRFIDPAERGRILGRLASGIFGGILIARALSGVLGEHVSWQAPFRIGALLCVATAVAICFVMPRMTALAHHSYARMLASLATVWRNEPTLRSAALTQALMFGSFNVYWIALPLRLASPAFGLGSAAVAWFALVGAAGVVVAPRLGKLVDRRGAHVGVAFGAACGVSAWLLTALSGSSLTVLGLGAILLDVGLTVAHISNQSRIFTLGQQARSRVGAVYILGLLSGAAIASPLTTWVWSRFGWQGVIVLGALPPAVVALRSFASRKSTPSLA